DQTQRLAAAGGDAEGVAPLLEADDRREQGRALVGQAIFVTQRPLAIGRLAEDAGLHQLLQPRREHVARDAEILLEVVEAAHAVEGIGHDQQGPRFADDVECGGDRTIHLFVGGAPHGKSIGRHRRGAICPKSRAQRRAGRRRTREPRNADTSDPPKKPKLTPAWWGATPNATAPRRRLMVKPMPPSTATPYKARHEAPAGMSARRSAISRPAPSTMPICLPRKRPAATPSATGCSRLPSDSSPSGRPALAKANTGMMTHDDHGLITCSSQIAGRSSSVSPAPLSGTKSASTTPASVA